MSVSQYLIVLVGSLAVAFWVYYRTSRHYIEKHRQEVQALRAAYRASEGLEPHEILDKHSTAVYDANVLEVFVEQLQHQMNGDPAFMNVIIRALDRTKAEQVQLREQARHL